MTEQEPIRLSNAHRRKHIRRWRNGKLTQAHRIQMSYVDTLQSQIQWYSGNAAQSSDFPQTRIH